MPKLFAVIETNAPNAWTARDFFAIQNDQQAQLLTPLLGALVTIAQSDCVAGVTPVLTVLDQATAWTIEPWTGGP